jgi:TonB family protein
MKIMNTKRSVKTLRDRSGFLIAIIWILGMVSLPALSQNVDNKTTTPLTYDQLEMKQDKIEKLSINVYKIMDNYPAASYRYIEHRNAVEVSGVSNDVDKNQLIGYVKEIESLRNEILNQANRTGVYYVAETEAEPAMGYDDFYDYLFNNLTYPEEAKDKGVEGIVRVRFVVDKDGEIKDVSADESIETSYSSLIDDLKMEAKTAVRATSGKWIPAKRGQTPVSQWVVLPVQFKLEDPHFHHF